MVAILSEKISCPCSSRSSLVLSASAFSSRAVCSFSRLDSQRYFIPLSIDASKQMGSYGLIIRSNAPCLMAFMATLRSAKAVMRITGTLGSRSLTCPSNSTPSISGIMTSLSTRSHSTSPKLVNASRPLAKLVTPWPCFSRIDTVTERTWSSSSTTMILPVRGSASLLFRMTLILRLPSAGIGVESLPHLCSQSISHLYKLRESLVFNSVPIR